LVKAAIIALGLALLLAVLVALIKHPRDTLLCLLTVMLIGLANARPMAFIVTLGIVCVAVVVAGAAAGFAAGVACAKASVVKASAATGRNDRMVRVIMVGFSGGR
jgi:hypothetical protein